MKVFLVLVIVAVLAVEFVDAQKRGTKQTNLTKEKQETKEKNAGLVKDTPRNKIQTAQLSSGVKGRTSIQQLSHISSNMKVSSNIQQTIGKKAGFKLPNGIHLPKGVPTGIPADMVGKATKQVKDRFGKTERHKPIGDYMRLKRAKLDAEAAKGNEH